MNKKILVLFPMLISLQLLMFDAAGANEIFLQSAKTRINKFIQKFEFPSVREVKLSVVIPEHNVVVFWVEFGRANDCAMGCFYSNAEGILSENKIGWIKVEDYSGFPKNYDSDQYDLGEYDHYLFSEEFYQKLTESRGWYHHPAFMELKAIDADTPLRTLYEYAEMLVNQRGLGPLASWLLKNPKIRQSREILTIIAWLPADYNEYKDAIHEAKSLLEAL